MDFRGASPGGYMRFTQNLRQSLGVYTEFLKHSFASFGGYFLKGEADPPPTAPVENINYMYEASLKNKKLYKILAHPIL